MAGMDFFTYQPPRIIINIIKYPLTTNNQTYISEKTKNCINRQEGTTGKPVQNITNHHKLGQIVAN